ncbi:hypothetical protein ACR34G_03530 [Mycoplasma sp. 480]|uniref:hypothetical protein n=1 Tax=Mycoplasma sp. 480 TaxID=3440155 RepID=UPI003F516E1D
MERRWDIKKVKFYFVFCLLSPIALMTTISCSETTQKAVEQQKKKSIPEKIEEYKDLVKRYYESLIQSEFDLYKTFAGKYANPSQLENIRNKYAEEIKEKLDRVKDFPNAKIPNEEYLDREINALKLIVFGPSVS